MRRPSPCAWLLTWNMIYHSGILFYSMRDRLQTLFFFISTTISINSIPISRITFCSPLFLRPLCWNSENSIKQMNEMMQNKSSLLWQKRFGHRTLRRHQIVVSSVYSFSTWLASLFFSSPELNPLSCGLFASISEEIKKKNHNFGSLLQGVMSHPMLSLVVYMLFKTISFYDYATFIVFV